MRAVRTCPLKSGDDRPRRIKRHPLRTHEPQQPHLIMLCYPFDVIHHYALLGQPCSFHRSIARQSVRRSFSPTTDICGRHAMSALVSLAPRARLSSSAALRTPTRPPRDRTARILPHTKYTRRVATRAADQTGHRQHNTGCAVLRVDRAVVLSIEPCNDHTL